MIGIKIGSSKVINSPNSWSEPPSITIVNWFSPQNTINAFSILISFLKKCFFYYSHKQRSTNICNIRIIFTTMYNLWSRSVIFWFVGAGLIFCHRDPSDGLSSWPRNQGGTKMKHGSGQKSRPHGEKRTEMQLTPTIISLIIIFVRVIIFAGRIHYCLSAQVPAVPLADILWYWYSFLHLPSSRPP